MGARRWWFSSTNTCCSCRGHRCSSCTRMTQNGYVNPVLYSQMPSSGHFMYLQAHDTQTLVTIYTQKICLRCPNVKVPRAFNSCGQRFISGMLLLSLFHVFTPLPRGDKCNNCMCVVIYYGEKLSWLCRTSGFVWVQPKTRTRKYTMVLYICFL